MYQKSYELLGLPEGAGLTEVGRINGAQKASGGIIAGHRRVS